MELLKGHLLSFVVSYHLFVFFNNANTVSVDMWVWSFGNHAWNKSLLSSHSSATRDLTRLLYHLWFPKPHTHISYSQHLHSVTSLINTWLLKVAKNYFKFAKSPIQINFRGIDFRGFLGLFYYIKVLFYE